MGVVTSGSGAVNDGGAGDEGASGEDSDAAFEEDTKADAAPTGGEFARAIDGDALSATSHPGEHRRRCERGDGGAQRGARAVE
jgi:hypothetical protein